MPFMKVLLNIKCALLTVILAFGACNTSCPPPEKPLSVPAEAIWCGGCDGGNWIQLVSVQDTTSYRFKVFRDWDGALQIDAIFKSEKMNDLLTLNNWQEKISHYNGHPSVDSLVCIYLSKDTNYLTVQYPAFGGEEWVIIKEKYNIN